MKAPTEVTMSEQRAKEPRERSMKNREGVIFFAGWRLSPDSPGLAQSGSQQTFAEAKKSSSFFLGVVTYVFGRTNPEDPRGNEISGHP